MASPGNIKTGRIASRAVIRNLILLFLLGFLVPFFGGRSAFAILFISEILGGGHCRASSIDGLAICGVGAICSGGPEPIAISSGSFSQLTCPDLTPTVENSAQSDGVVDGRGVGSSAQGMTSSFNLGSDALGAIQIAMAHMIEILLNPRKPVTF